jgi:competence protein ComEA
MQANHDAKLKSFLDAASSLTKLQKAVIVLLIVTLCAGAALAYIRSRPRAVEVSGGAVSASGGDRQKVLTIHVAGAVQRPGLYKLDEGTRVADALQRAGGAAPDALLDDLNLASRLTDGQKVLVPRAVTAAPAAGTAATPAPGSRLINLNTASAEEIDGLPGVGHALAGRIVDYRKKNGPFSSVDDLDNIEGIGPKKLENFKDLVTI